MKIHIDYEFKEGAWGGANQFLKALRKGIKEKGLYEDNAMDSDIILFNSNPGAIPSFKRLVKLKKDKSALKIVNRIDGPVYYIREKEIFADRQLFLFDDLFASATIYQSPWSKENCHKLGMKENPLCTTIMNSPDSSIFYKREKHNDEADDRTKLIITSWSDNIRKGFDFYKYLDENLDFKRFKVSFVGNSPYQFSNIVMIPPKNSGELVEYLAQSDIYLTGSVNDPCSNSLIEALHIGLPSVVLNSGGHPWIVGNAGETFSSNEDLIQSIEKVAENINDYKSKINVPDFETTVDLYIDFLKRVHLSGEHKSVNLTKELSYTSLNSLYNIFNKFDRKFSLSKGRL